MKLILMMLLAVQLHAEQLYYLAPIVQDKQLVPTYTCDFKSNVDPRTACAVSGSHLTTTYRPDINLSAGLSYITLSLKSNLDGTPYLGYMSCSGVKRGQAELAGPCTPTPAAYAVVLVDTKDQASFQADNVNLLPFPKAAFDVQVKNLPSEEKSHADTVLTVVGADKSTLVDGKTQKDLVEQVGRQLDPDFDITAAKVTSIK